MKRVVITDGAAGSLVCDEQGSRRIPAYRAARVVDSTGAGDAFLGGYLAGEALGLEPDAARLGNACGAACIERIGTFPDEPSALRARIVALYDGAKPKDVRWDDFVAGAAVGVAAGAAGAGGASAVPYASAAAGRRVLEVVVRELAQLAARHDGASLLAAAELIEASKRRAGGSTSPESESPSTSHVMRPACSPRRESRRPFSTPPRPFTEVSGRSCPATSSSRSATTRTTSECLLAARAVRDYGGRLIAVTGGLASPLAGLSLFLKAPEISKRRMGGYIPFL